MSNQLIEAQRYEIYLGLKRKWSRSRIAEEIGVSKSTVSREIRRNSKPEGEYIWKYAQRQCDSRKHGFKGHHRKPEDLWWRIERMIEEEEWSPAQIAGVLRKEGIHIAKQTIYNHVHADTTGKLLCICLMAQIQKARQNPVSDKSDQYTQPHKHTRAPQGGRRNPIRRLGNGHHHRLLRSCHRHPNRTFDQFHTHGKVASGTESPTDGPGGHPTAVPI